MYKKFCYARTPDEKERVCSQLLTSIECDERTITDLVTIWESGLCGNTLFAGAGNESVRQIGKGLGIDMMVDAYASGVPAEDVAA